ncbi:hypothetical protein ACIF9R_27005 [Streptomyces sp. NPDC086080]|uniref:hypothetical protein n=1 Tax=Streptomyces sp. NPDC086080 TaxID=3365748 RepID=UPI0037D621A3
MAESSRPRLPRWGHSVLRPGSGGTTAPDRGRACLTVPVGDIDVSTTNTPTPAAPPPATTAGVPPDRTGTV